MVIYVTLANFGERFLLRSNQFMLRKIFFIDKLLLTFFFFCSEFNSDICPVKFMSHICDPLSLGYRFEKISGFFYALLVAIESGFHYVDI